MVFGNNASMTVKDSTFPDMFGPEENPALLGLDNVAEHIKIIGRTPTGGVLRIENNSFGTNKGHNDVIDADSNRVSAGPILQIIGNTFAGAGDELLDLGGDVFVYGNTFKNVFKDDTTSDRGYANAISTGDAGSETTIVVAKNVFYDVDHAINLKNQAAAIFESNTVVRVHPDFLDRFENPNVGSVVNLFVDEPFATAGKGAYLADNILWDVPRVFGNVDLPTNASVLEAHGNVIGAADLSVGNRANNVFALGSGNSVGDPRFRNIDELDFSLQDGSSGLSIDGGDEKGVFGPAMRIDGEPSSPSNGLLTRLKVGGPGIFSYRYRLNGGAWSEEIPIGNGFDPNRTVRSSDIVLASLDNGEYTVEVQGRDFAGNWLTEIARSKSWTVNRGQPLVQINEILADNRGSHVNAGTSPDVVELVNHGTGVIDLQGFSLSDRMDEPDKFTFTADRPVRPGELVVLYADPVSDALPGVHLGFSLDSAGEGLYLFAPEVIDQPRELVDFVEFGNQLTNLSIGRVGSTGEWKLTEPTIGLPNQAAATGSADNVRINEWLAISDSEDDFIELYNRDPLPVGLGEFSLSDEVGGSPQKHMLPPLTFMAGNGFLHLEADGSKRPGHLDFTLSADQEVIGLLDPDGKVIDSVLYIGPVPGQSRGRKPDGATTLETFTPTPGWANGTTTPGDFDVDGVIGSVDVDLLCTAIRDSDDAQVFDLNRDGVVNRLDMSELIVGILNTTYGDSNLDGIFNSTDLVQVFRSGEYEDGVARNSTWAEGDWNCDGEFGTADLVVAFQSGGYSALARPMQTLAAPSYQNSRSAMVDAAIDQLWADDDQDRKKRQA